MAGARARKLDLSGYLSGKSNVANIISQTGESVARSISAKGDAHLSAIARFGANMREDKQRGEAKAERATERDYRQKRDTFHDSLALKAEARAEADQKIQEEEHKIKVASLAKTVEESATLISRARAAAATGMPMDPKVLEEIQRRATGIQAGGGPTAIMAQAAAQEEGDPEGLIRQTGQYEALSTLLTQQMGREKDPVKHAALGDAFMQLSGLIDGNKSRLRLHDANTKRRGDKAAKDAEAADKITHELDAFKNVAQREFPDLTNEEMVAYGSAIQSGGITAETALSRIKGKRDADAVKANRDAARGRAEERLGMARERHAASIARAVEARQSTEAGAYERVVNDVEEDYREADKDYDRASKENSGASPEEIASKRAIYEDAKAVRDHIRAGRPNNKAAAQVPVDKVNRAISGAKAAGAAVGGMFGGGRGGTVAEQVKAIEDAPGMSAAEKLKALDALEARAGGR